MSGSRKVLIVGGIALAIWGMSYGLWYALFDEHQTLERMGVTLAEAFAHAADRNLAGTDASINAFAATKFEYVREVDVHSHWIGLAMLLIILGVVFDRVAFRERTRVLLAWTMLGGSVLFPLGVILQTLDRGIGPQALAAAGSTAVTVGLAAAAFGFWRERAA
jgi:hypothetical protein